MGRKSFHPLSGLRDTWRHVNRTHHKAVVWTLAVTLGLLAVWLTLYTLKSHMIRKQVSVWEDLEYRAMDLSVAYGLDLDPAVVADHLVRAIIQIESSGNPHAVGAAGERGLMQIMPGTWRDMTQKAYGAAMPFDRAFDPELNQRVGRLYLAYIQHLLHEHRAEWQADERSLILASYNGGPYRVIRAGFDIQQLPASVQAYVQRGSELHDQLLEESMAHVESPTRE